MTPRSIDSRPLRIAMIGTRGVPAAYGGFETAIEEIGKRLAATGHDVTVFCRTKAGTPKRGEYLGMKLIHLPAVKSKALETLSHTALSVLRMLVGRRHDVAFVFNAANSPFIPVIKARRVPVAVHVDGLEWKRGKWGRTGRKYYRVAEQLSVRWADALIADAQGISDYYTDEFGVPTELIAYGAHIDRTGASNRLAELGLESRKFHLAVARFEPENHVDLIVEGYHASGANYPLVVVGSAPYSAEYTDRVYDVAASDDRIHMLGGVWDQELLDQLYGNALTYLHGHSVGGTNPSLLRGMGAATAVVAWDVVFNREVLGEDGIFFCTATDVADAVVAAETTTTSTIGVGERLRERAARLYNWDDVAVGYGALAKRLASGASIRGTSKGRRTDSAWSVVDEATSTKHTPSTTQGTKR